MRQGTSEEGGFLNENGGGVVGNDNDKLRGSYIYLASLGRTEYRREHK